jgi:hypothetical protein
MSCDQTGDFFFTAGIGKVNAALFNTVENRADQVRQPERLRHCRVQFAGNLPEIIEVMTRKDDRLHLVRRSRRSSFLYRWHHVH